MKKPTPQIITRLNKEKNIWFASVRPNSKPHLVPVWFIWHAEAIFICISGKSIKSINISHNSQVSVALEDGTTPVICEGFSKRVGSPWPENIVSRFQKKYEWNIETDQDYDELVRVSPQKWLYWK